MRVVVGFQVMVGPTDGASEWEGRRVTAPLPPQQTPPNWCQPDCGLKDRPCVSAGAGLFGGITTGKHARAEWTQALSTRPIISSASLFGFGMVPVRSAHTTEVVVEEAAHRPRGSGLPASLSPCTRLGLFHQRGMTLAHALDVLAMPVLAPGQALQAAREIANLSLQASVREQMVAPAALETLVWALRHHLRETGTHLCIAIARIATDVKLVQIITAHDKFCATLLELAEAPTRSAPAGRALALCVHKWPQDELDERRVLAVLKRLLTIENTELQTDVVRAFARMSRSQHGVRALSRHSMFSSMIAVASTTHVPVVNTLCANTLQLACETSASDVQLDALALVRLHDLATPHSKGDEENSTAATLQQVSATLHQVLTFQDKVVGVWQSCNTILKRTHRSPSIDCLRHSCTVGIVWPCQSEKIGQGSQVRET
mmetsp:Transcript_31842/g.46538  ORF Transcript_31842/g.46538 Transcript_31842/m.46538 type:complete len:431 (+) Transcript_31842:38-1330(+)